jgi:large subunit ribosomal protein L19e
VKLKAQKKLAARILGVGIGRVRINPARASDIAAAISREDIKRLIQDGAIGVRPKRGVSRARARKRAEKRKKGRRRGVGSRKGAAKARLPKKEAWIRTTRPLRAMLRELRSKRVIDAREYRRLYRMVKGGTFRGKAHLKTYLKERGVLKE